MEIHIWLTYGFKTTWSSRYSSLRSSFVPSLFPFQVVSNNIRTKIKMNGGNDITCFPEGKAWYLENQNEIFLAADQRCNFGGWVLPDRPPPPWPHLHSYPWSSAEPPLACPEVLTAPGLHHNTRILSFEKRKFQYLWAGAKLGNVNRSNDLCPASRCLR